MISNENYQEIVKYMERVRNPPFCDRLLQQYEKEYLRKPTWSWIVYLRMIDRASVYDVDVIDYIKKLIEKDET